MPCHGSFQSFLEHTSVLKRRVLLNWTQNMSWHPDDLSVQSSNATKTKIPTQKYTRHRVAYSPAHNTRCLDLITLNSSTLVPGWMNFPTYSDSRQTVSRSASNHKRWSVQVDACEYILMLPWAHRKNELGKRLYLNLVLICKLNLNL